MHKNAHVLIRADANAQMGTGHVMRCLSLAQALRDENRRVTFASAETTAALEARLDSEGIATERLSENPGSDEDAIATANLVARIGAKWVVLDGYHLDGDYQRRVKTAGVRVLAIDDYGHAPHYYADLVLNQNLHATEQLYASREPYTQLLLGARYVLLRREFRQWRTWQRQIPQRGSKVLVTLGGADPDNITSRVIEAIGQSASPDLHITVVIGASNPHREKLAAAVEKLRSYIRLVDDVNNMAELMVWADVAIAAGGTTSWELARLGLPTLMLVLAENQKPVAAALHEAGAARNMGCASEISAAGIAAELRSLLNSRDDRCRMSAVGRRIVDGDGCARVTMHLMGRRLRLRAASQEDCRLIWEWANDPVVRSVSFRSDPIPWDDHVRWFESQLRNPGTSFFIGLNASDEPIGQVRFDADGEAATISVSLAVSQRSRGYGTEMIAFSSQQLFAQRPQIQTIRAVIKSGNEGSRKAFEKAGFSEPRPVTEHGQSAIVLQMHREQR